MARKPTTPPEAIEETPINEAALSDIQNTGGLLAAVASEEHALVNQLLGQAQMATSMAQFSLTVSTSKMAFVKENKLYRALSRQKSADGQQLSGTWDEFCGLLGISRQKADEDILNLRQLGEEALESMSRMGIGYREMRQFRKLPEDEKQALIEVAQSGDKADFVELAEQFIEKASKDKEALQRERDEARADYEAQSELLSKKNTELDATRFELERTRRRIQEQTPDEAMAQLKVEASGILVELESAISLKLDVALETLLDHAHEAGVDATDNRLYMANLIAHVERKLLALRDKYQLPDDLSTAELEWHTPEAQAAALAAVEAAKAGRG